MTAPTGDSSGRPPPISPLLSGQTLLNHPSINGRSSKWRRRNGAASIALQVAFNDPVEWGYLSP